MTNDCFTSAEIRNVRATRSMRKEYFNNAIGFVRLKRESGICTVKCEICPEHKIRTNNYKAIIVVDEKSSQILSSECHDCAASTGGCKHALAFLMWIHYKSVESSPTDVENYWKKPSLSCATSSKLKVSDFGAVSPVIAPDVAKFKKRVIEDGGAQEELGMKNLNFLNITVHFHLLHAYKYLVCLVNALAFMDVASIMVYLSILQKLR